MKTTLYPRAIVEILLFGLALILVSWAWRADSAWFDRHFLPYFRIRDRQLRLEIGILRAFAVGAALVLIAVVRPWLVRLVRRRSLGSVLVAALPSIVAAVLAVVTTEMILRYTIEVSHARKAATGEPLRDRDPEIGWVVRPNRAGYDRRDGRMTAYAFDASGLRVARMGDAIDPTRPTVLFVGESIMLGYRLNWSDTTAGQVQAMTGRQSANLAVEGYSLDQSFMLFRRQWPRFTRPVAVVTLMLPSAIYRIAEEDRPHLTPQLDWRPARGESSLRHVARRWVPYRSDEEIDRAIVVARQVLLRTQTMAEQKGARALVLVPVFEPDTAAEAVLRRRILDGLGVECAFAHINRDWLIPGDRHPDERGARRMAEVVASWLQSEPSDCREAQ